ncbi:MAG: hypothetical protein M3N14_11290 [Bacteroidota bacterium]|nr:hypothetical protein [Bacteroidota bacterium]
MTNSILEITEHEYLIKLNRNTFNLSLIRSLLKMVEVSNPAQDLHSNNSLYIAHSQNQSAEPGYYGSIDEK